jgi:hypothetical protein
MSQTIGEASGFMRAATGRVEDTPLIRFINEVERRAAGADLASTPIYDIRAGFDTGEISVGDVYRIYPSENTLRAVRISARDFEATWSRARYWYVDSAGAVFTNAYVPGPNYDVIGGAEYTVDLSRPAGSRITELSVRASRCSRQTAFLALGVSASRGKELPDASRCPSCTTGVNDPRPADQRSSPPKETGSRSLRRLIVEAGSRLCSPRGPGVVRETWNTGFGRPRPACLLRCLR